jgi:glyoxylase-like metal-dependent hydrolase (beta-lactamase superfamily II)
MDTSFLATFSAAGVTPSEIDLVVNTHLHPDHVGWNTQFLGGTWQPTFPNATYVFPRADYDMLVGLAASGDPDPFSYGTAFPDSIEPVVQGEPNVQFWEGDEYVIDASLRLLASPGHSPGASVLAVSSEGEHAIFAADTVHHPMQIINPDQRVVLDSDHPLAATTRRRVLGWAVEHKAALIPCHFAYGRGARIQQRDAGFEIDSWVQVPGPVLA